MNLSIALCTSREYPNVEWFYDSIVRQVGAGDNIEVIVIDSFVGSVEEFRDFSNGSKVSMRTRRPKPCFWSGKFRLTKEEWWSKSNSLNTFFCLAQHPWVCVVDDRSVILPGWLDCIRTQMAAKEPYVLCGAYEKRTNMTVENGVIKNAGIIIGKDSRAEYCEKHYSNPAHQLSPPYKAPGEWTYGCTISLPLEWALNVGGFEEETCDGMSAEDTAFGLMLANNGYPIKYDPRMMLIEDRTPGQIGPVAIRRDKGVSPNDKSHAALDKLKGLKHTLNKFDIRKLRDDALAGKPWPAPSGSDRDWFDGQPLSEMTLN